MVAPLRDRRGLTRVPPRLRDLERAARAFGLQLEEPRSGSHWKFVNGAGGMYPVPAHNARNSEVPDQYVRGLCRYFGIDPVELRRKL